MSLQVKGISKAYGQQIVLEDFSLRIDPGEIVIILGESGSGKTTLLRMINQLEAVDEGSISLDGVDLVVDGVYQPANRARYQQEIGLVFQDYQLFPHLTVWDNLLLAARANQLASDAELTQRAERLLDRMGLRDKKDQVPRQLSGGQQQRVAIARAMMLQPSLLCFDEPTSALDERTVQRVANIIQQLADEGMMVLIITHDLELVRYLGDSARVVQSETFRPEVERV